jgi:large subunit ribosomal protein L30
MNETLTYSQIKSSIGCSNGIKAVLLGLGLTRINKIVTKKNTPELRGMLIKVRHLVKLEE